MRAVFAFTIIAVVIAAIVGWMMNVVKILMVMGNGFEQAGMEIVVRGVGVFVLPFGAVAGYF